MSSKRTVIPALVGVIASVGLSWACVPASAGVPAKLQAEYTFDSVGGNGNVVDTTGRGHQLTLAGNYSTTAGVRTPAVAFAPISRASTPHQVDLNPDGREFAVTVTFRLPGDTSGLTDTPNLVQKGFWSDDAQWKMQLEPVAAAVQCRFKGTLGARLLTSSVSGVDDAAWHTATCWRSGNQVGVTVDGVDTSDIAATGTITNTRPMLIGAKSLTSSTDQFSGTIDYVSVAAGNNAARVSRQDAP
ncbi:MAG: LamG domain-containing protein [Actinomycetes bacterium]